MLAVGSFGLLLSLTLGSHLGQGDVKGKIIHGEHPKCIQAAFAYQLPEDGVQTKFSDPHRIYLVRILSEDQKHLIALEAVCPNDGKKPNWLASDQRFKCPHCGSGFRRDGSWFEGFEAPSARRSLKRLAIKVDKNGAWK
jgi:Rieske Fe-S protein